MICAMTGREHQLFWMRSAWWCAECRQKIESCCEGGGCPSVVETQAPAFGPVGTPAREPASAPAREPAAAPSAREAA